MNSPADAMDETSEFARLHYERLDHPEPIPVGEAIELPSWWGWALYNEAKRNWK